MNIRKGTSADLNGIERIYDAILTEEEQGRGHTNWQRGVYPTRKDAQEALNAGTLHVAVEGNDVVAAANLNHIQLPEYDDIDWAFPAEGDEVMVIHTLVVCPHQSGKGIGRAFVAYAEELGRSQGCKVMRLDTYEGNTPAAALYRKLGYRDAGKTKFNFYGIIEYLILLEKLL